MGLGGFLKGFGKFAAKNIANTFAPGSGEVLDSIFSAGGKAAGDMANAAANNRGTKFAGQMDLANMMAQRDAELQRLKAQADNDYTANQIARESSGMATRNDAWRKLLSAQHTMNPGAAPQLAGKYNIAPRQATDMERTGADAMSQEVMARLQGGNPIAAVEKRTPAFDYDPMKTIDPRLLDPGKGEKIGGTLAPILTGISGISSQIRGPRMYTGGAAPTTPTLSAADLAWLRTQNPQLMHTMQT